MRHQERCRRLPVGDPMARARENAAAAPTEAGDVIAFWRAAGPGAWFAKDDDFDRRFREQFAAIFHQAERGELSGWTSTAEGAWALVLLLDQYPRNAFRGTPRAFATDADARRIADAAVAAGYDRAVDPELSLFFYLPFEHSEDLADQDRSVALIARLGEPAQTHALHHREIMRRFGRFPHRNPILGRDMTDEERQFLQQDSFLG